MLNRYEYWNAIRGGSFAVRECPKCKLYNVNLWDYKTRKEEHPLTECENCEAPLNKQASWVEIEAEKRGSALYRFYLEKLFPPLEILENEDLQKIVGWCNWHIKQNKKNKVTRIGAILSKFRCILLMKWEAFIKRNDRRRRFKVFLLNIGLAWTGDESVFRCEKCNRKLFLYDCYRPWVKGVGVKNYCTIKCYKSPLAKKGLSENSPNADKGL